jgi:quercetin dioxygenase-like cupin family protein
MESFSLDEMVKGWFVGGFHPSALKTEACEVAFKRYKSGDYEPAHYHQVATEVTFVASGRVRMCEKEWGAGSIIVLAPGEVTNFFALEDSDTMVVKVPSVKGDKYLV